MAHCLLTQGRINVWSGANDGRLVIRWTESGGPLVTPPVHQGFGTRVMTNMMRQHKGDMRLDWKPEGFACEIIIPLPS